MGAGMPRTLSLLCLFSITLLYSRFVLLACVRGHQGSPQVHTAPGPIKRLRIPALAALDPNTGNCLKSQIACPVPNPGYSETLAASLGFYGYPDVR